MRQSELNQITGVDEAVMRSAVGAARFWAHGVEAGDPPSAPRRDDDQTHPTSELFARAAWSYLVEPGDGIAGALITALGAPEALELVIAEYDSNSGLARARAGGVEQNEIDDTVLQAALARWRPRLNRAAIVRACALAERSKSALLVPGDELWPGALDDLGPHAPIALWWRGRTAALRSLSASISLVGSRACSTYGEHVTMEASAGLVDRGFTIISGAAYGIDGMAHRAALASNGKTIAVLAGGLDRFYPSGHTELITRIAESGAVISEVSCGVSPTKWRFLQRNRIISALGQATIVLEAGRRSGSLNTASHAAAIGRPVGAVPGPVTSPTSAGCHRLLRETDAVCVTTAQQMAELVRPWEVEGEGSLLTDVLRDPSETRVLDSLSTRSARSVDEVAVRAGMSAATVLGVLGTLGLDGLVRERERGWLRGRG